MSSKRESNKARVPRPSNAFILFRKSKNDDPQYKDMRFEEKSKALGLAWKSLPACEKAVWRERSRAVAAEHKLRHPNYVFKPARGLNKKKEGKAENENLLLLSPGVEEDGGASQTLMTHSSLRTAAASQQHDSEHLSPSAITDIINAAQILYFNQGNSPESNCGSNVYNPLGINHLENILGDFMVRKCITFYHFLRQLMLYLWLHCNVGPAFQLSWVPPNEFI